MTPEQAQLLDQIAQIVLQGGVGGRLSVINLVDFIPTVSAVPTLTPRNFLDQFRIYHNSTTYRFYWYDTANREWRYATGT